MSVPLYTEGFPERPAYAEALTHALLDRANAGELDEAVRLCVPGRLVSFGKLDAFAPGFAAAVAAAERAGFAAVHRVGGGRAAVFHEGTILFSHVVRDEDPRPHTHDRYRRLAAAVLEALHALGVDDARVGAVPGEYCPGDYSLGAGRIKLVGIAQRIVRRAACTQGVLVVAGGDLVRAVLEPVYEAMALDWDPATAGDLGGVAWTTRWPRCAPRSSGACRCWRRRSTARDARARRGARAGARRLGAAPGRPGGRAGQGPRLVVVRPGRPDRADLDQLALAGDRLDDLLLLGLALAAAGLRVAGHAHAARWAPSRRRPRRGRR